MQSFFPFMLVLPHLCTARSLASSVANSKPPQLTCASAEDTAPTLDLARALVDVDRFCSSLFANHITNPDGTIPLSVYGGGFQETLNSARPSMTLTIAPREALYSLTMRECIKNFHEIINGCSTASLGASDGASTSRGGSYLAAGEDGIAEFGCELGSDGLADLNPWQTALSAD